VFTVFNYKKCFKIFGTCIVAGFLLSLTGVNSVAANYSQTHNLHFGPIASINQDWILAGKWMANMNETNKTDAGFYSIFNMVMINGSAPHIHKIYNATVTNMTKQGNNTVFHGTVSITMKDGPVDNVPTQVTIANNNTIAISMDPSKTNNHFGNTPIYGLIHNFEEGIKTMKMMTNDPEMMKKWIPLMTGDMLNNMKSWKMNQTMKNDNDSMAENMSMMDSSMMKDNTTQAVQ
jgi:hypothetical protein